MRYHWEHAEVTKLAADITGVPADVNRDCKRAVKGYALMLKTMWVQNATRSAGRHGKLYPKTIRSFVKGMEAEIRPFPGTPHSGNQSGMNFEYGSPSVISKPDPEGQGGELGQRVGQTRPHLDMNRAADIVFPLFEERIASNAEIPL